MAETMAAMFATSSTAAAAGSAATAVAAGGDAFLAAEAAAGAAGTVFTGASGGGLLASISSSIAGLGVKDWLFGGVTAFSALSSIAAGKTQAAGFESQRMMEEFASKQEILKGRKEALDAQDKLNDTLELNIVRAAAGGVTGEGSVRAASDAAISKSNFEVGITRDNAEINAGARRAQADQLGLEADAAEQPGVANAGGTVANSFFRLARR